MHHNNVVNVLPLTCPHEVPNLEAPGVALITLIGDLKPLLLVGALFNGLAMCCVVAVVTRLVDLCGLCNSVCTRINSAWYEFYKLDH